MAKRRLRQVMESSFSVQPNTLLLSSGGRSDNERFSPRVRGHSPHCHQWADTTLHFMCFLHECSAGIVLTWSTLLFQVIKHTYGCKRNYAKEETARKSCMYMIGRSRRWFPVMAMLREGVRKPPVASGFKKAEKGHLNNIM